MRPLCCQKSMWWSRACSAREGVEYTADANTAGEEKGMILIGHWVSDDQGMRLCADWLKTFISEVPIQWISAGDPFWRP
jgi:hypothetical protein